MGRKELRGNHELLGKTVSFLNIVNIIIILTNTFRINNKIAVAVCASSVPSTVITLLHIISSHPPVSPVSVILWIITLCFRGEGPRDRETLNPSPTKRRTKTRTPVAHSPSASSPLAWSTWQQSTSLFPFLQCLEGETLQLFRCGASCSFDSACFLFPPLVISTGLQMLRFFSPQKTSLHTASP